MLLHCVGVGGIGSLFAFHLSQNARNTLRLILRRPPTAANLAQASARISDPPPQPAKAPLPPAYGVLPKPVSSTAPSQHMAAITIERDGMSQTSTGLSLELHPSGVAEAASADGFPGPTGISRTPSNRGNRPRQPPILQRSDSIASLIVTTKAQGTVSVLRDLTNRIQPNSTITIIQNGMGVVDDLCESLFPDPEERPSFVIGTTTHGVYPKPGSTGLWTVHAAVGDLTFGVLPSARVRRAIQDQIARSAAASGAIDQQRLAEVLEANPILNPSSPLLPTLQSHLPLTEATTSLYSTVHALLSLPDSMPGSVRWVPLAELEQTQLRKLTINAAINPITAVTHARNGWITVSGSHPLVEDMRHLVKSICAEASDVFWALTQSRPHHRLAGDRFPRDHPLSTPSLIDGVMNVAKATKANISSTLQDVIVTRPNTELDYINGYISRLGQRFGIPTPVNDTVASLAKLRVGVKYFKKKASRLARQEFKKNRRKDGEAQASSSDTLSDDDSERESVTDGPDGRAPWMTNAEVGPSQESREANRFNAVGDGISQEGLATVAPRAGMEEQ